ncbi:MAG TPA: GAF domain-containing sensor histidine kinase [Candidatus Eisenbacteria bacterium]|nr:GAF domain-containing sensor histidine kinase [Candidatus Eisenbacteria bacterium]
MTPFVNASSVLPERDGYAADPALQAAYEADLRAVTLRRLRGACACALIPIGISAALNPLVFSTRVEERLVTHAVQAGICLLTLVGCALKTTQRRADVLAALMLCAINTSLFWSLSLSADDMDVLVSIVSGAMVLSPMVFPWSARTQAAVSLYSAAGYLAVLPLPIFATTRVYNVGLSLTFAVTASITGAFVLDRHRRAVFYERERVASLAHQRELLIDAGRLLNSTLALPELVALVTDLCQRLTGADAVALCLLDAEPLTFRVVATVSSAMTAGGLDGHARVDGVDEVFCDMLARNGAIAGPSPTVVLPTVAGVSDQPHTLFVAVQREQALLGMLVFGFASGDASTGHARLQIARGVAQMAAVALTNARLYDELETASRLRSEFVSTISHELRTPLNVMLGYLEMVRDPDLPTEEKQQLFDRTQQNGFQLLELIESTLEIGRIDAGRDEVRYENVHFTVFWRELGRDCAHLRKPESVALEWESPVPDVVIRTDPRKLTIIVRNLVGNALKFTERGHVRAETTIDRGALSIVIQDTGVGIRPEDQEAIFEKFRQADGSETRRYGGSGLGLYLVRRFAQQLGGSVVVSSVAGQGSTFTVRLPLSGASAVPRAA